MTLALLATLLEHAAWANARALAALRATPDPEGTRRLAHLLAAERVWLARLRGEPPDGPVWPALDLDACERLAGETRAGLAAYLAGLGDADLGREVAYRTSAGDAYRSSVADILTHVAMHGEHHRGQIALLVRAAGGTPPTTDYVAFVRGAR